MTSLRAVSSPLPCGSSTRVLRPQIPFPGHVGLQSPQLPQSPTWLGKVLHSSSPPLHLKLENSDGQYWETLLCRHMITYSSTTANLIFTKLLIGGEPESLNCMKDGIRGLHVITYSTTHSRDVVSGRIVIMSSVRFDFQLESVQVSSMTPLW